MRIKFLCIIICLFVNALVFASATNHTITGVVISGEDNEPLIGASVYVHADDLKKAGVSQTSLGTITDIDGKFSGKSDSYSLQLYWVRRTSDYIARK